MKIALMQPYLFPYRGYFDLITAADKFVLYDDAKWIRNGWIQRNNFPEFFVFRVRQHSDYARINQCRFFNLKEDIRKFKRRFPKLKADKYLDVLDPKLDVAGNCFKTLRLICDDLGIRTPFYLSSQIPHRRWINGIIDIVKALDGDTYINLPGGKKIYTQEQFGDIKIEFIETKPGPSILCEL